MENRADGVLAPRMGSIVVGATTADTATASIDLGADAVGRYLTLMCDNGTGTLATFYVTFDESDVSTAPDPSATSGDGRCIAVYTGRLDVLIDTASRHMRLRSEATGFYRYYFSSSRG